MGMILALAAQKRSFSLCGQRVVSAKRKKSISGRRRTTRENNSAQ
jgi:hypothetical protein